MHGLRRFMILVFLFNSSCSEFLSDGKSTVETPKEISRPKSIDGTPQGTNPEFVDFTEDPTFVVSRSNCSRLQDYKYSNGSLEVNLTNLSFDSSSFFGENTSAKDFCLVSGKVSIPSNHVFSIELQDTFQQVKAELKSGDVASFSIDMKFEFKGVNYGDTYSADIYDLSEGVRDLHFTKKGHDAADVSAYSPMTCDDVRKTETITKFEIKYSSFIALARSGSALETKNVSVEFLREPKFFLKLKKCR